MRDIVERRKSSIATSHRKDGPSPVTSAASGALPYFRRGEFGMWHWVDRDDGTGAMIVSREAFSNIDDCEKDAIRHQKYRRVRIAV
jgi:hypothetical protein